MPKGKLFIACLIKLLRVLSLVSWGMETFVKGCLSVCFLKSMRFKMIVQNSFWRLMVSFPNCKLICENCAAPPRKSEYSHTIYSNTRSRTKSKNLERHQRRLAEVKRAKEEQQLLQAADTQKKKKKLNTGFTVWEEQLWSLSSFQKLPVTELGS